MKKQDKKQLVTEMGVKIVFDRTTGKFKTFIKPSEDVDYIRVRTMIDLVRALVPNGMRITETVRKVERTIHKWDKDFEMEKIHKTDVFHDLIIDGTQIGSIPRT